MRATTLPIPPTEGASPRTEPGPFLAGITEDHLRCMQACLGLHACTFEKDEDILSCTGGPVTYGVLLSGAALDVRRHPHGDRTLVDVIEPGDLFGEGWQTPRWGSAACPQERAAVGAVPGTVLLLDPARLSDPAVACPAKAVVQNNLLRSVLEKQERLRAKLEILRHRSLRKRITNYLLVEAQRRGAQRRGAARFSIPLTRIELAQYLHADRAALSRELARMRTDGLIDYHRNSFVIPDPRAAALILD
ncbi:Crp/Fnr family transcriptional regulator [Leucobacter chromiireducens]|uniref:Crp/Fnr family transcriptional regulator n=1 Tax=Leucobacter chromiireducens subsp. solipictus TaxID=398235 RepID=A0ABS1SFV0_9MICO|nr:Crp/Fnr family transcriptional regulator [Leucobacter chromiireducens]MBL3679281.1 Crp/Fnr family transcriptional regulator [Leucobacter chromiireducens subsp. solipictus]